MDPVRIQVQKHMDSTDPDADPYPQHWSALALAIGGEWFSPLLSNQKHKIAAPKQTSFHLTSSHLQHATIKQK
jgi:hypothetical protein